MRDNRVTTDLTRALRDAGFQYSANELYDRAADRLEKLEHLLTVAQRCHRRLGRVGDSFVKEFEQAVVECSVDDQALRDVYMVVRTSVGVVVQTLKDYREHGGFKERWGQPWRPVLATSIDDARERAKDLP